MNQSPPSVRVREVQPLRAIVRSPATDRAAREAHAPRPHQWRRLRLSPCRAVETFGNHLWQTQTFPPLHLLGLVVCPRRAFARWRQVLPTRNNGGPIRDLSTPHTRSGSPSVI